ncbi:MAG: hypothetical protein JXR37_06250 [Kiritimatiellae bacterium]|nr:hypothetical protein [Kiritimatiellia bacterium]
MRRRISRMVLAVSVSVVFWGPWPHAIALQYGFTPGCRYRYEVEYGEESASATSSVACQLEIAVLRESRSDAEQEGKETGNDAERFYELSVSLRSFSYVGAFDAGAPINPTELLPRLGALTYSATVGNNGTIRATNLEDVLAAWKLPPGQDEAVRPIVEARTYIPLTALIWDRLFPLVRADRRGKMTFRARDWKALGVERIDSVAGDSDFPVRTAWSPPSDAGTPGPEITVLWSEHSEVKALRALGYPCDVRTSVVFRSHLNHDMGVFNRLDETHDESIVDDDGKRGGKAFFRCRLVGFRKQGE